MKTIYFVLMLAVFANAQDIINPERSCNDGKKHLYTNQSGTQEMRYNLPNIPETSCVITVEHISPGHNNAPTGTTIFFFDHELKIKKDQKDVSIRFVVYNDDVNYNALQALVQTAYAMRSKMTVIFENPTLELLTENEFYSKRKTTQKCYAVNNLSDEIASINCPIQSIGLERN